ncbi:MAG: 50S ribosomal protein L21 [Vicinamibacterales bacterium]|nr:50S ribosomal protein L21 [Vicinamibacterales bacterium]
MFAIIQAAGHQVKVEPGQHIDVDRLGAQDGAEVTFDRVLLVSRDDGSLVAGSPVVGGARVVGVVDAHHRGPKIRVFRRKRRKGMRRTRGHRSDLTRIRITDITAD